MKKNIFIQEICSDCLQSIVNDENDRDGREMVQMRRTINAWAEDRYFPLGLTDNTESFFSPVKCDLCDQIAGDRYQYHFIQK